MNHGSRKRSGYVLVLTLGIIALAAIALTGLARYSLQLATCANASADELQQRWGLFSARYMLLDRAAEILEAQVPDEEADTPPWPKLSQLSATFNLGTHEFRVTIADEDAKVNLNALHTRKRDRVLPVIRQLSQEASTSLLVRPSPQSEVHSPFASWGQVFDLANTLSAEVSVGAELGEAARYLTCWGSGRLNLRRASDAALLEVAALVIPAGKVSELVELRKHWGGQTADELIDQLELRRPQQLAVRRLLSTESRSYSMWLNVKNGQRTSSFLYVRDGEMFCFAW